MGCDINGWTEVKKDGKWIAYKPFTEFAENRNYARFAKLGGVRAKEGDEVVEAKGIPEDVSDTVKHNIDLWGNDGFCHSYMSIKEAFDIFWKTDDKRNYYSLESLFDLKKRNR